MSEPVAVVGGGLGGLAAAIRLQAAGEQVLLLEQGPHLGGKCNRLEWEAYTFDTGPSLLTMPFVVEALFESADRERTDYLEWDRLEPACRYFFPDGTRFDMMGNLEASREGIREHFPDQLDGWDRFIQYGKQLWDISGPAFLFHPLDWKVPFRVNVFQALANLGKLRPKPMDQAIQEHFSDPRLIQLFRRYATYNGSDPSRTPATFNVIPYVELAFGSWHCKGGMYALVSALEQLALDLGVEIQVGTGVETLSFSANGKQVSALNLVGGERLGAKQVVVNLDAITALAGDLFSNHPLHAYWGNRYKDREASVSGFVSLLAVKGAVPGLDCHNIFFCEDYDREFKQVFTEANALEDPTLYLHNPSHIDSSLAPEGGASWFLLANAPSLDRFSKWNEFYGPFIQDHLWSQMQRHELDLDSLEVSWTHTRNPTYFRDTYGAWQGALYGLSSNTVSDAFFRVRNDFPRVENLFFAGGSAHPGGGIPLVLLSGKMAAEAALR